MPLFFSDYDKRSKIEQAIDYINESLNKIKDEEKEYNKAVLGSDRKIMKVTMCGQMGKVYASISSYANNSAYYKDSYKTICEKAMKHANELWAEVEKAHQENLEAIENNKRIVEAVKTLMTKIGIMPTYSTYDYKSNRSRTRTESKHSAGYLDDLRRSVITDDGYTMAKNHYDDFVRRVDAYRKEFEQKEKLEEAKKVAEQKKIQESKELAALTIKYNLDYNSDWESVRDAILEKNKYLELAYWLEMQRNDWNDGFYKARNAINSFKVETELDQKIYGSLSEILENVEDGREFRDCEYNYSVLYEMVEDQSLVSDLRIVLNHYEMSW